METKKKLLVTHFYVVKGSGSLINADTADALNWITFCTNKISMKEQIINEYKDVSTGVGRLKDVEIKLHIDKTAKPVIQQCRRIPLPLREKVERELQRLEDEGIIEKVYEPTEWVSPIVIQPKKNFEEIRICTDMREANKAISRVRHTIPTLEEIRHKLNGAIYFSKVDLTKAYHQLKLHPQSRGITTTTHVGLRRNTV